MNPVDLGYGITWDGRYIRIDVEQLEVEADAIGIASGCSATALHLIGEVVGRNVFGMRPLAVNEVMDRNTNN
jgi:hypothetical protein